MWTKDEVRTIATIWEHETADDVAKKLKRTKTQINYMTAQMRRAGFKLAKKHRKGTLLVMLGEVLKEHKGK